MIKPDSCCLKLNLTPEITCLVDGIETIETIFNRIDKNKTLVKQTFDITLYFKTPVVVFHDYFFGRIKYNSLSIELTNDMSNVEDFSISPKAFLSSETKNNNFTKSFSLIIHKLRLRETFDVICGQMSALEAINYEWKCPKATEEISNLTFLKCSKSKLNHVTLIGKNIAAIRPNSFESLVNLKNFTLRNANIAAIYSNALARNVRNENVTFDFDKTMIYAMEPESFLGTNSLLTTIVIQEYTWLGSQKSPEAFQNYFDENKSNRMVVKIVNQTQLQVHL